MMKTTVWTSLLVGLALAPGCSKTSGCGGPLTPVAVQRAPTGVIGLSLEVNGDRDQALGVLRRRVAEIKAKGLLDSGEVTVEVHGGSGLTVTLEFFGECDQPALDRLAKALTRQMTRSGELYFRHAPRQTAESLASTQATLKSAGGQPGEPEGRASVSVTGLAAKAVDTALAAVTAPDGAEWLLEAPADKSGRVVVWAAIGPRIVTGADIKTALVTVQPHDNAPAVSLEMTDDAGQRFREWTGAHVDEHLAIVVEGRAVSVPVVQEEIPGGRAIISLGAGPAPELVRQAQEMAAVLRAGALVADVELNHTQALCIPPR